MRRSAGIPTSARSCAAPRHENIEPWRVKCSGASRSLDCKASSAPSWTRLSGLNPWMFGQLKKMIRPDTQPSPQLYARTIGVLYLIVIVVGFFAYGYVPGKVVSADVAITARNILAHELLWRTGIVAGLIVVVAATPQLLFEYLLLRPVQRSVMLLAVIFNVLSLAIESVSALGHLAALAILSGQDSLTGVTTHQLQAWASLAIDLHDADLNISFLFFGCVCLSYGYLIYRSTFLPRFLGVLMTLAGL